MVAADASDGPSRASAAVFDGGALGVVDDLEVAAPADGRGHRSGAGVGHLPQRPERARRHLAVPAARRARPRGRRRRRAGRARRGGMGRGRRRRHPRPLTPCGACPACRRGHPTACAEAFGRRARRFTRAGDGVRRLRQRGLVLRAHHRVGPPARRRRGPRRSARRACSAAPSRPAWARSATWPRVAAGRPGGGDRHRRHRRQRRPGRPRSPAPPSPPSTAPPSRRAVAERFGADAFASADEVDGLDAVVRRGHRVQRRAGGHRHRHRPHRPRWHDGAGGPATPAATGRRST